MTMHPKLYGIGMTSVRTRNRLVKRLKEQGVSMPNVLDVMRNMPRHLFVDEALASRAYEDTALPIGFGQTISQPYVVARMTEALMEKEPVPKTVLEVGTGSGYQTAILSQLVDQVYTVERIRGLYDRTLDKLTRFGVDNVDFRLSDGSWGWSEKAPFDGIIVTAAPESVPESLLDQLAIGGRLIIPVGPQGAQQLLSIERTSNGFERNVMDFVSFVPLLGGADA